MAAATTNTPEERRNGIVLWFSDLKGYGLIKSHDGTEELFVHQSAITSDGFRSLTAGDEVEFSVIFEDNKSKAVNVTALNGSPLRRNPPTRFGNRTRSNGCYTCGKTGHIARDCNGNFNNGNKGGCFNCGESGHIAKDCGDRVRNGGWNKGGCFNCGESGHIARECGLNEVNVVVNSGSNGPCYRCGDFGHIARECVNEIGSVVTRGGNGVGGRGRGCYTCGETGHFARECSNGDVGMRRSGGFGGTGCFNCGGRGHFARECPSPAMV